MALRDLIYRCPSCGSFEIEGDRRRVSCAQCETEVRRDAAGRGLLRLVKERPHVAKWVSAATLVDEIERLGGPSRVDLSAKGIEEARVRLSFASGQGTPLRFKGDLLGFIERFRPTQEGVLRLDRDSIWFEPDPEKSSRSEVLQTPLLEMKALQTSSKALQWVGQGDRVFLVRFIEDSPRRWDDCLKHAVRSAWARAERGEILEFQPRIRGTGSESSPGPRSQPVAAWARSHDPRGAQPFPEQVYRGAKSIARTLLGRWAQIEVKGLEHIPASGPFLLLPNHQSALDPLLVQGYCPRLVRSMTKSTQFGGAFMGFLLPRLGAFPVRRFRVDPQAVRSVLKRLYEGSGVCIYPEGERTWDGRLQPFRRGTLRLALRVSDQGIPVIPVGISGMFEAWPRWGGPFRSGGQVLLSFGEPLRVPSASPPEARIDLIETELERAIQSLLLKK